MRKKVIGAIALFIISIIICMTNKVNAISTSNANEPIDTEKLCNLILTYKIEEIPREGLEIEIYQVSSVTKDFKYNVVGDFSKYPININGIKNQDEWNEIRNTIGNYIAIDKINPTKTEFTDENGKVNFSNLPVGVYYIRWTENKTEKEIEGFAPFMICLPELNEEGNFIYDVEALPKPGLFPENETDEFTVILLWNDGVLKSIRPKKVSVDVYRDEEFFETIELSEENNWTLSWKVDEKHKWNVIERGLPDGYTISYDSETKLIIITNTIKPEIIPEIDSEEYDELKVRIEWKDTNLREMRPKSVTVDIYRDGEIYETVDVTEENNWNYFWKTEGKHTWNVVERDLPDGYKIVYDSEKNVFIIINAINAGNNEKPNNPHTGDNIYIYLIFMGIALLGLILTAVAFKIGRSNNIDE